MMRLYMKQALVSVHKKIELTDEQGNVLYSSASKFFTAHDKTTIKDAKGAELATLTRKLLSIRAKYIIEMADGKTLTMHDELKHLVAEVFDIEELGWTIRGNFAEHDYELLDSNGDILAAAHRKWISMHQAYELEVLNTKNLDYIAVVLIVLEHVLFIRSEVRDDVAATAIDKGIVDQFLKN